MASIPFTEDELNSRYFILKQILMNRIKMTHYKLWYFNARGQSEVIRLIFSASGVQYEGKFIKLFTMFA